MAVKSVSELNEVTTLNDDDLFMVSTKDGSGNYSSSNKLTYGSLKSLMPSGSGSGSGSPFFRLSSVTSTTLTRVEHNVIWLNNEHPDVYELYFSDADGNKTTDELSAEK